MAFCKHVCYSSHTTVIAISHINKTRQESVVTDNRDFFHFICKDYNKQHEGKNKHRMHILHSSCSKPSRDVGFEYGCKRVCRITCIPIQLYVEQPFLQHPNGCVPEFREGTEWVGCLGSTAVLR